MNWLEPDTAAEVRYRALEALAEGPQWSTGLVQGLKDPSWRVRRLATERLARCVPTQPLVDALIPLLAEPGDPGTRNAAAQALSQMGAVALPSMTQLLGDARPDVRKFAAEILGELGRSESVPSLIAALYDADTNVRVAAAEALGRIGDDASLRALRRLLDQPEAVIKVSALEGLTHAGRAPSLPMLVPLLADRWTRGSAYRALGLVEHPTAWGLLTRALADDDTRDAALTALGTRGRLPPPEHEAALRDALKAMPDAVVWLGRALEAEGLERRLGALLASQALGEPSLSLPVARSVRPGVTAEVALRVLVHLGVRGARRLVSSVATLAELTGPARAVATEALVRLSEPSLVAPFVALLRAGDAELSELALRALGRSRARTAITPLLAMLTDDDLGPVAARALVELAESWPQEVREALEPLVAGRARPSVVRAWADIAGDDALPVLQRAANDEDEDVRAAAVAASVAAPAGTVTLLRAALLDEAPTVRRAAAGAFARCEGSQVEALVARTLDDADAVTLSRAIRAVGALRLQALRSEVTRRVSHADAQVVLAVLEALAVLGGLEDAVLQRAAQHADTEVLKQVLAVGADRPLVVQLARTSLSHAQWDVRVTAGRVLAVSGSSDDLALLKDAVAREVDPVAREALEGLSHLVP